MIADYYITAMGSNNAYPPELKALYRAWTGKEFGKLASLNEFFVLAKVRSTGELVGALQLIILSDNVHNRHWGLVENVYTHPDHRRRGIGQELMRFAELQAQQFECSHIKLTSRKREGQALYRSLGYVEGASFYKPLVPDVLYYDKKVVVAVAGYFDPIHEGHLDHIEKARELGDKLVVVAGTEEQCDQKHGRHFHAWEGKVRLLKKLGASEVVPNIDTDGTCAETLRNLNLKPNIFARGGDEMDSVIPQSEIDACQEIGCRVVFGVGDRLNRSSLFWSSAV